MRYPAAGDEFRWRVSVAHIDGSGPFSDFAAYNRKMVLLRGAGIALRFGDGEQKTLRRVANWWSSMGPLPRTASCWMARAWI